MADFISFETLTRPAKPNTYLVAPDGLCANAKVDAASPDLLGSPRGVFSQLSEIIASERRWGKLRVDPEGLRLRFIARSALMRFTDDIDIRVLTANEAGGATRVAIYSRSRIGYSDLGANAKRVNDLLARLIAK